MLILWDVDGTLLRSQRAGISAMLDAAREMFGDHFTFDGVEVSGRLDPLIWADGGRLNGIENITEHLDTLRSVYHGHLERRLRTNPTAVALPGVAELIAGLQDHADVTQGLLTGNYRDAARMKIRAAGLDPEVFALGAWGDDGPTRRDLPPVAMSRYAQHRGRAIEPDRVLIIGDTPHDVDCARHHGCRSIAVETGMFGREQLEAAGADLVVENLAETGRLLHWILQTPAAIP